MKTYIFMLFIISIFSSCSQYTINEDESGETDRINLYMKFQKNAGGEAFDLEYPVVIYSVDKENSAVTEFWYNDGDAVTASLSKGEYSINAFLGMSDACFIKTNDITGKPMIAVNGNGVSDRPLMAAHASINLNKQTEINFIPAYVMSSLEFEFSNIPSEVKNIDVKIYPVSCGYNIEGGFSDRKEMAYIECRHDDEKWTSCQKFIFPVQGEKTSVTVSIDYGDEVKDYLYTFSEGLKLGQPYRFTGGYDDNLNLSGEFQFSGWKEEEEIFMDFDGESDDDITVDEGDESGDNASGENGDLVYVESMPTVNTVWRDFYLWKLEDTGAGEALATIISPDQWFQIYAEGEAKEILNGYEIDGISGWRTFTREEAEEFYKEFSAELDELNNLLEKNGHNIFYTDDSRRYLCEDGDYTFGLYGKLNFYKAGKTVKYYLRPVKKVFFQTYTH